MLNILVENNKKITEKNHRIKFINDSLLFKYIKKIAIKDDIDFVAFGISHWHAIGVDSAVYDISKQKNKEPKGLIIICAHPKDGFLIKEKDFICNNFAKVEFCFLDSNLNSLQNNKFIIFRAHRTFKRLINILGAIIKIRKVGKNEKHNNKKEVTIITVMNPDTSFLEIFNDKYVSNHFVPVYFIIDEGFGTYTSKKAWKITRKLDNQDKKLGHFSYLKDIEDNIKKEIRDNFIKKIAIKYINIENRFLFNKKKEKLIPNLSIINSYKNIFLKRKEISLKIYDIKSIFPTAIILTDPFSEYKLATLKYELKILERVVSILIQKGYSVVIKPHPRESDNKYTPILKKYNSGQLKITRKDFPAEDLFCILNPLCTIGYGSTALISANIIFDLSAISISRIFLNGNSLKKNSILEKMGICEFEKLTKGLVCNINSFKQLENKLEKINY